MRLPPALGLVAAFALVIAACGQSAGSKAAQASSASPAGGDQIRAYIMDHPEIIEEALGRLQTKRQAAADEQIKLALRANRAKLEHDPRDFVAGNPNGKVTLVEFFDYRCPYCKAATPELDKLLATNKDVRLVLKEFPILSDVSVTAARAAIAAKAQGKYWPVHQALLTEKSLDDVSIARVLKDNGVDPIKAITVANAPTTTQLIDDNHALSKLTGVNGTPAFLIGDKMISGWMPDEIQSSIEAERKAG